jgi:predicted nicotinamide N-methyase
MGSDELPPSTSPELLLLAVVEWDDEGQIDEDGDKEHGIVEPRSRGRIQKIRVASKDVTKPPIVTVVDLQNVLRREQRQRGRATQHKCASPNTESLEELDSMIVRVYDASLRDWISFPTTASASHEDDLVARFGRRIRVQVSFRQQDESPAARLALQGRYLASEWLDEERIVVDGTVLRIHQLSNRPDTASCVWDGATLLARFLERNVVARTWIRNRRVLELGAGCGLAGIAAGVLGATSVVLTDLACHLPLLRQNVAENSPAWKSKGCKRMVCCECDWTRPPPHFTADDGTVVDSTFDVILVADCVWMEHLVDPLLNTIDQFATRSIGRTDGGARVIFSYQRRGKGTDDRFWRGLRDRFGTIEVLSDHDKDYHSLGQPDVLKIISVRKEIANDDA